MPYLRLASHQKLQQLCLTAQGSTRRRCHLPIHLELSDPIQRFFNALQPGTYVRPHTHAPGRFELFLLLSGKAGILVFHGQEVVETALLSPKTARAVEIPGGVCHTLLCLAPNTLLFEVKPGPYEALSDKDFAPWAPAEGDPRAHQLLTRWEKLFIAPKDCT